MPNQQSPKPAKPNRSVAIVNKQTILERIAKGEKQVDIAAEYGITQQALSKQLVDDPDFKIAREVGTIARLELFEKELEAIDESTSQVVFARTRELLSHARWRAEREYPQRFGTKPDAAQGLTIQVIINDPMQAGSVTIEQEKDPI